MPGRPKGIKEKKKRNRKFPPSTVPKVRSRPVLEQVLSAEEEMAIALESKCGQQPIVSHPKELFAMFRYYINWNKNHPWPTADLRVIKGKVRDINKEAKVGIPRPLSLVNFCHINGVSGSWWRALRVRMADNPEMSSAIESIDHAIKNNILDGALVGVFQGGLAARVLNISDRVDHTSGGEKLQTVPPINVYNTAPPFASSEDEVEEVKSTKPLLINGKKKEV